LGGNFGKYGPRRFHTGGVFAGLSENSWKTTCKAVETAKQNGVIVSYDLNYRDSYGSIAAEWQ